MEQARILTTCDPSWQASIKRASRAQRYQTKYNPRRAASLNQHRWWGQAEQAEHTRTDQLESEEYAVKIGKDRSNEKALPEETTPATNEEAIEIGKHLSKEKAKAPDS